MGGMLRNRTAAFAVAAAAAVAVVLLAGPARISEALSASRWWLVAAALAAYLVFFALRGIRWSLLLGNPAVAGAPACASMSAVAWGVSSFIPFKAGDVLRAVWMGRRARIGTVRCAASIAVERTLDLFGLALLASIGLAFLAYAGVAPTGSVWALLLAFAWILPLVALAGILLAARLLRGRPQGRRLRAVAAGLEGMRLMVRDPRRFLPALGLTLAVCLAQAAVHALLALALLPTLAPWAASAAAPLFLLTFAFPATPAHIGTYEAGFVAAYALSGIAPAQLLAAAVAAHLLGLGLVVTLAAVGFVLLRTDPAASVPPSGQAEVAP